MIRFLQKQSALFSVLLILPLMGTYIGKSTFQYGISPYSTAVMELDQRVFEKLSYKKKFDDFLEEQRTKNKILRIISQYQPNVDMEWVRQIPNLIFQESRKYGYDPLFLTALIVTESSFNNWAKSHAGALGLMQLRPRTGWAMAQETRTHWEGKPSLFKPDTNIALGAYYLNKLVGRFKDMELALEAYNHGPSQLMRYLNQGKPPYDYSTKVFDIYDLIRSKTV